MPRILSSLLQLNKAGMLLYNSNLRTPRVETEEWEVQDRLWLYGKFEAAFYVNLIQANVIWKEGNFN